MKIKFLIPASIFLFSCGNTDHVEDNSNVDNDSTELVVEELDTIPPFKEIESNFSSKDLILPEGFTYTVFFSEGDDVTRADGEKFPAKGNHDLSIFIPDESNPDTKGVLYVSHETKYKDENLGDGGGATMFDVEKIDGVWQVIGAFDHIDFSGVGYTNRNCGGSLTPNGLFLHVKRLGRILQITYTMMGKE